MLFEWTRSVFRPYSNKYYKHHERGTYRCKICGQDLFLSKTKYEAGTGWPSFFDVIDKQSVVYRPDASGGTYVVGRFADLVIFPKNPAFKSWTIFETS